jgi:hypothetical protein
MAFVLEHEIQEFVDLVGIGAHVATAQLQETDGQAFDHDVVADERVHVVARSDALFDRLAEAPEVRCDELPQTRFTQAELREFAAEVFEVRTLFVGLDQEVLAGRRIVGNERREVGRAGERDLLARDEVRETALEEFGRGGHQLEGRQRLDQIDPGEVVDREDHPQQPRIAKCGVDDQFGQPVLQRHRTRSRR